MQNTINSPQLYFKPQFEWDEANLRKDTKIALGEVQKKEEPAEALVYEQEEQMM